MPDLTASKGFFPASIGNADVSQAELIAVGGLTIPQNSPQLIKLSVPVNMPNRRLYKMVSLTPSNANDYGLLLRWSFFAGSQFLTSVIDGFSNALPSGSAIKRSFPQLTVGDWEPVVHARSDVRLCLAAQNATAPPNGPGEVNPIAVLRPFPLNIACDTIVLGVDQAINVTSIYRVFLMCISDQGTTS